GRLAPAALIARITVHALRLRHHTHLVRRHLIRAHLLTLLRRELATTEATGHEHASPLREVVSEGLRLLPPHSHPVERGAVVLPLVAHLLAVVLREIEVQDRLPI